MFDPQVNFQRGGGLFDPPDLTVPAPLIMISKLREIIF